LRSACATLAVAVGLAACGGDAADEQRAECLSTPPEEGATYAGDDVAFATGEGGALQAERVDGEFPWFAKVGLLVRGSGTVVVSVPEEAAVRIKGWGGDAFSLRTDVVIESSPSCEADWTAYPGGLVFSGRQCVRLRVEGPSGEPTSAILALRRECPG